MQIEGSYPGIPQHQALLKAIVAHYRDDARILAVSLFGSLARGTWDLYSDLDLDVVIGDAVQMDMTEFFDFVNQPWMTPPSPPAQDRSKPCYLDHLP